MEVHQFQLMLYTGLLVTAELGAMVLAVAALGMAAQVLLASCLSGYAKLRSDLRPSQAAPDRSVNQDRQFCFGLVALDPDVPDLVQEFVCRQPGNSLRHTRLVNGTLSRRSGLRPAGAPCRFAFRPAHATSMRAGSDTPAPRA